jgi:hypothetical protein
LIKGRLTSLVVSLAVLVGLVMATGLSTTSGTTLASTASQPVPADLLVPPNDRFGLNRASFGAIGIPGQKLHLAPEAGAVWNRWPMYWYQIESESGFDYSAYDRAVAADLVRGTSLNLVLMGTPSDFSTAGIPTLSPPRLGERRPAGDYRWRAGSETGEVSSQVSTPQNLDQPVFADGTDDFAPGKQVNPDNYWARFVNLTVQRYKPDGELQKHGLVPPGVGVRHWEVWNEPDVPFYWYGRGPGSDITDYARLLKVSYLATKAADPQAQVIMGGLNYWGRPDWLPTLIDLLKEDESAAGHGYYFDVLAWHVYSRTIEMFNRPDWTRHLLADKGISGKEIWVNETNVPTFGDPTPYNRDPNTHRATPQEQASFILQAYAYGLHGGADRIFTFMLYDDCWAWGEHYGLVRNPPGTYEFSDCAGDGETRPGYLAYKLAAQHLRDIKSSHLQSLGPGGNGEVITFDREDGSRVSVMWNKYGSPISIDFPVRPGAVLVEQNGASRVVELGEDGKVRIDLPQSTANDAHIGFPPDFMIGGYTYLLIEPAPPAASGAIANGGFEEREDLAGWWAGGVAPSIVPHGLSGDRAAMLMVSPPHTGSSWVRQTVALPASSSPKLNLSYALSTTQPVNGPASELSYFEVTARAAGGTETVLLVDSRPKGWTSRSIDLSRFAGRAVTLTFNLRGDHYSTAVYLDDISLWTHRIILPVISTE